MELNIKTGANITRLLQSTVTVPQAYTELVKNSIQNGATQCDILLNKYSTVIIDNGSGFDHMKDSQHMSDFDKYFVYGNSYSTNTDESTSLGQMGIGGKLSNDRLSDPDKPWWTIETKNIHGNSFIMTYKPTDMFEFLDDYNPTVHPVDPRECKIETETGSRITIHNLDPEILDNGWAYDDIRRELASFFGMLVYELQKQGKTFNLTLDEEPINFAYDLPGIQIPPFTSNFNYVDHSGDEKSAPVRFQMAMVGDWSDMEDHPLTGLSIISYVKISDLWLSDGKLIESAMKRVLNEESFRNQEVHITQDQIMKHSSSLIGFISCKELSTVLDRTGMPAKDLTHHTLRPDHMITTPFLKHVYYTLVKWCIEYHVRMNAKTTSVIDAISKEISALVAEQFFDDNLDLDIYSSDDGMVEELADELDMGTSDGPEAVRLRDSVKAAINKQQEKTMSEDNKNLFDIPKNDWTQKMARKNKKSRYIPYLLMDFGSEEVMMISKLDNFHKFRVLINTGNPKYKFFEEIDIPELISMFISEILIKEILYKKEGKYIKSDVDQKISEFYAKYLEKVRERIISVM
jgi:hypothetical protein